MDYRKVLSKAETIVIKVGTSSITYDTGRLNLGILEKLALVISDLKNQGKRVILVTSGAIGVGSVKLGLKKKPEKMSEKQASAAIGQCELMHIYDKLFAEFGYHTGQILLTREDVSDSKRKRNVINTFDTLLNYNAIPIVNENDSIATEEIEFGDNDTLSAIVSELIGAELLIILSDIEGLYDKNPRENENAKLIPFVEVIDEVIEKAAGEKGTTRGTGGMLTKIAAAKIAAKAGTNMVIANGADPFVIRRIIDGDEIGTLFVSRKEKK
ncbi:MAG: glutamate 5-kinase [Ignavibacteriales bacterium]